MAKRIEQTEPVMLNLPDAVDLIRFEKNLLQIGFFGAHERRGKQAVSSRRIVQWVNRDGKKIKVSAEFRSSDALGLPSTSDRDKYMAFMKLAMETRLRNGVITNPIRFSGYSLLNALGQCDSGENYEALNSWGMRMADTTITSEQVIYSSLRKRYMNKTVHVFRSFTRLGSSNLDGSSKVDLFEVELEDWLLENLNEAFVVPEDFNMYRKLVRPTAKGIFVYLYLWFFASQGKEVEKDYTELCALLNVRAYDHVSKIRETMGLSLTDLVNIGYLKSWDIKPMSSKVGYKLVLTPGRALKEVLLLTQRKQLAFAAAHLEPTLSAAQELVKAALIEKGVSPVKAAELIQKLDPAVVQDRLEYADAQVNADRKGSIKNPAGYLISFIEGGQAIPSSFQSGRQKDQARRRKGEEDAARDEGQLRSLEAMQLQEEYKRWCLNEAEAHIARTFGDDLLVKRLKAISSRLRKDSSSAEALDRMTPALRKAELKRVLRKEVAQELGLPSLEEWVAENPQGDLFGVAGTLGCKRYSFWDYSPCKSKAVYLIYMAIERVDRVLVKEALKRQAAVAIIGPRQVGKTTLARDIADQHPGSLYLDLEAREDREKLTEPVLFLREYENALVVLDEIHRVPELFSSLRGLIDQGRRAGRGTGRFLILGSASIDLLRQSGESLAGRITYVEMGPFNTQELPADEPTLLKLWLRGGFPGSYLAADDTTSLRWRNDFIRTYLERDVSEFGPRIPAGVLERLWTMLAHGQGTLLNNARLASGLQISAPTVGRYIDLLSDLLLVRRLAPFHRNDGKRLVKSPKVYVRDSGLVHALLGLKTYNDVAGHPVAGSSWEGCVIENLLAAAPERTVASFYRTAAGAEIDLLLEIPGHGMWAIEVKRSLSGRPEKGFYIACDDLQPDRRYVVNAGITEYPIGHATTAIGLAGLTQVLAGLK